MKNKTQKKGRRILLSILTVFSLFLGTIAFSAGIWFCKVFGDVGFDSVLFTLTNSLRGSNMDTILQFMLEALLPAILITAALSVVLLTHWKKPLVISFRKKALTLLPMRRTVAALMAGILSFSLIVTTIETTGCGKYLSDQMKASTIYEEKYVDPNDVDIKFPEKKRNLVYIVLESMENTFMSQEAGGGISNDLMPELVTLSKENVSFSHTDGLGGFYNTAGTTWSVGSLVSVTAGIHFQLPFGTGRNSYTDDYDRFLPGATTLMDILHEQGYFQQYLLGCDADFGGLRQFFSQHNTDEVIDYYTALEKGWIPKDYFKWWGFEDKKLMEFAKEQLTRLSESGQPFALYISTMDTHCTGGYYCEDCGNEFNEQYDNVISCFSKRIAAFMEWMQEQPFMEDTTVVLVGDHLTMDNPYIMRNVAKDYLRTAYNCFVNSSVEPVSTKNRLYASFDLFPTILASMGCEIPGNRLGLGTNLFSEEKTLMEEYGSFVALNSQLTRYSDYFAKYIAQYF